MVLLTSSFHEYMLYSRCSKHICRKYLLTCNISIFSYNNQNKVYIACVAKANSIKSASFVSAVYWIVKYMLFLLNCSVARCIYNNEVATVSFHSKKDKKFLRSYHVY